MFRKASMRNWFWVIWNTRWPKPSSRPMLHTLWKKLLQSTIVLWTCFFMYKLRTTILSTLASNPWKVNVHIMFPVVSRAVIILQCWISQAPGATSATNEFPRIVVFCVWKLINKRLGTKTSRSPAYRPTHDCTMLKNPCLLTSLTQPSSAPRSECSKRSPNPNQNFHLVPDSQ